MPSGQAARISKALLTNEGFVESFFAESSVGLNLCRMDGHWLESNPAFLRIIGYDAEEANDGKLSYWQLTPRKYDADEAIQLKRLADTGRYGPYEKEFVRKNGSLVPVRLSGFIVEHDGEKFIWSFIEDITAERDLQLERLKAIQASKLSAMGEMAAAIAHEINNPLTIIGGYAFTLSDAIESGDDALVAECIAEIRHAVARAAAITNGLRRLSRGTADAAFEAVDVRQVISEATLLTGARTRAEGLEVEVEVATQAQVRGNAVQLGQVVINLVNNAVDAVKGAPERKIVLRARDVGSEVLLTVEDSGPGVGDAHLGRLFDRFFTTKNVDEGTGLGLAVSRDIVESMGGTISYQRFENRTHFDVRLPLLASSEVRA